MLSEKAIVNGLSILCHVLLKFVRTIMMRERRERQVEKERGRGCVYGGGKRKKMKE